MDRLRRELLLRKKKQVGDVLSSRKRKLSNLFYLSLYPNYPVSEDQLLEHKADHDAFLSQTDLVSGNGFDETLLPIALTQSGRKSSSAEAESGDQPVTKKRKLSAEEVEVKNQDTQDNLQNEKSEKDGKKLAKEDGAVEARSDVKNNAKIDANEEVKPTLVKAVSADKPKKTVTIVSDSPNSAITTLKTRSKVPPSKNTSIRIPNRQNPRSFIFPDDKNCELMLFVVPDRLPEPPQSRRPLSELFYTTQTLPLSNILPASHKALTTDNYQLSLLEGKLSVVHSRIEELKRLDKWSLRQHAKNKGPYRAKTHWDNLLDEAKWLREDVREERKLKIALAYELANAVEDYWRLGKEVCCVTYKRKHAPIQEQDEDRDRDETGEAIAEISTPKETDAGAVSADMVEIADVSADHEEPNTHVGKADISMEEPHEKKDEKADNGPSESAESADQVAVGQEEQNTKGLKSAVAVSENTETVDPSSVMGNDANKHFSHLNSLVPLKVAEDVWLSNHFETCFKTSIEPEQLNSVSKELLSNLAYISAFSPNTPYVNEFDNLSLTSVANFLSAPDLERGWQRVVLDKISTERSFGRRAAASSSASTDKPEPKHSLFALDSRRRYVSIKAPKPPNIKYLEYRTPTIWLPQDDNKLMKLVKEFSYNWDIVALHMLPQATNGYLSNIERRTPWQCFERWHQLTPSFPLSDLKGPYSNAAQVWLESAVKAQAITKRRISPLGVGPESIQRGNKRLRWASMFDAMRKSMRKRENAPRPNNTVQRKSQLNDSKANIPTPFELSKMKWERDKSIAEAYQQQQRMQLELAARNRASSSAAAGGSSGNARGGVGSSTAPVVNTHSSSAAPPGPTAAANTPASATAAVAATGLGPRPSSAAGRGSTNSGGLPGVPLPSGSGQRPSQEQLDQMMRAEKRRQLLRQQAAAIAATGSNEAGTNSNGAPSSAGTPRSVTPSGMTPAQRQQHQNTVTAVLAMLQQSLNGIGNSQHLVTLASQITAQHPNLPAEQIAKIAHAQIQRYRVQLQQKQQAAAAAAANAGEPNSVRQGTPTGSVDGQIPVNMAGGLSNAQAQAMLQRQAGQGVRLTSQQQQQQVMAQVLRAQQHQMLQNQASNQGHAQNQNRVSSSSPSPSTMQFPQ